PPGTAAHNCPNSRHPAWHPPARPRSRRRSDRARPRSGRPPRFRSCVLRPCEPLPVAIPRADRAKPRPPRRRGISARSNRRGNGSGGGSRVGRDHERISGDAARLDAGDAMTASSSGAVGELTATRPFPARHGPKGSALYRMITTTDPKVLGILYLVSATAFFLIGGLLALLMRGELARPGLQFLSPEQFNQLFTMH